MDSLAPLMPLGLLLFFLAGLALVVGHPRTSAVLWLAVVVSPP